MVQRFEPVPDPEGRLTPPPRKPPTAVGVATPPPPAPDAPPAPPAIPAYSLVARNTVLGAGLIGVGGLLLAGPAAPALGVGCFVGGGLTLARAAWLGWRRRRMLRARSASDRRAA